MNNLDFITLHEEKLEFIFSNIEILASMKESDTMLPPKFFKEINDDVISDYKAKMSILKKNARFVIRELKKDFKQMRKVQKKRQMLLRKQLIKANQLDKKPVD